jgi:uncharacterized protein (TIGR00251 family)
MTNGQLSKTRPDAVIKVKVIPRASRNQIVGFEETMIKVKLTAPPVEGRANKALKELLAKRLAVSKGCVDIISGKQSRQKLVRIHGLSGEEVNALLKKP